MNNIEIFNNLKKNFINLKDFSMKNNYIVYNNNNNVAICYLGKIELQNIDNSLFNLNPNEIMYILKNISLMINNSNELQKKINFTDALLNFENITNEHISYIYNYVNDYYTRKNIHEKYAYEGDLEEINKMAYPIHKSYDETLNSFNNPAATYIRTLETDYFEKILKESSSTQKQDIYVRQLKSAYNVVKIEDYQKAAGFMSATFIISIVVIIGLIIAIILYAL